MIHRVGQERRRETDAKNAQKRHQVQAMRMQVRKVAAGVAVGVAA